MPYPGRVRSPSPTMTRLSTPLALALAAALSLPSLAHAQSAPAQAAGVQAAGTVETARYATLAEAVAAVVPEETELAVPGVLPSDGFGLSVSLYGDRALVGAPFVDDAGSASGAAYVIAFDGSQPAGQQWALEAKLIADDGAPSAYFGDAVSLHGDRALIGAYNDDNPSGASGSAYVFVFDASQPAGQQWTQEAKLTATDDVPGDNNFGESVSLSAGRALIGASADGDAAYNAGAAYVFALDASRPSGEQWVQEAKLVADDAGSQDRFGRVVSLDGDRALVGAPYDAVDFEGDRGSAYVFSFDGQAWSQQEKLTVPDAVGYYFGGAVSLSGHRALIGGAIPNGGDDYSNSNEAYVFAFDGSQPAEQQWTLEQTLRETPPTGGVREFGTAVSLDGDHALVGAPRTQFTSSQLEGEVYVLTLDVTQPPGEQWVESSRLSITGGNPDLWFGFSVSLSGDRALVGAPRLAAQPQVFGAAYIYDLELGAPLVADAGPDQTVVAGQTVALDGSASTDAQTFAWALDGAVLSTGSPTASFCAAAPGLYTATLTVSNADGSDADAVAVTAVSASDALGALVTDVAATPGPNRDQKRALVAELKKAQRALARGLSPAPFLASFRSQVLGLEADGTLTAAAADALVVSVDAVAEATASPCTEAAGAPQTAAATAGEGFGLSVWPNPSAGRATVAFTVEAAGAVRLSVVDALGREVAVLREGAVEAGRHTAVLDAAALPAGVYLVRLATADGPAATERITRLR